MTITGAQYQHDGFILATVDGAEMTIPDDMGNRERKMIADWEAKGNKIAPYVKPVVTPPPARYSKKRLFEAMTDAEFATFEQAEAQQSKKDRRVFAEAQELVSDDPGFVRFKGLLDKVYGAARAKALLDAAAY